jgi:hypothetical protein
MRVSLGDEKPFASTSVEAVKIRQRRPFPWPGRAPLLILKLPRIAGHGNRLQSGKRGQTSRRAVGSQDQADELRCREDAAGAVGLLHGIIRKPEAKWPGLTNYLNRTGLRSDPRLIQKLAALAGRW